MSNKRMSPGYARMMSRGDPEALRQRVLAEQEEAMKEAVERRTRAEAMDARDRASPTSEQSYPIPHVKRRKGRK